LLDELLHPLQVACPFVLVRIVVVSAIEQFQGRPPCDPVARAYLALCMRVDLCDYDVRAAVAVCKFFVDWIEVFAV
jgi:hypothetical protein